jgi:hypothetical protein
MKDRLPPIPFHMRSLPRDTRGFPIPAMVQYDDAGKPLFPVIDMEKWGKLARDRGCGICGKAMHRGYWFVGGPKAIENRIFTDLPMHRECAVFSLKVCPYLALPRFRYILRDVTLPDGKVVNVNNDVSTQRPERFGLALTPHYRMALLASDVNPNGSPVLQAAPFDSVEWWSTGALLSA